MAARFLSTRKIDAIYSSPLLRARQTALAVAAMNKIEVHFRRALLEVKSGYQGQSNTILKPSFSFYEPQVSPQDETMQQVLDRMMGVLRSVVRRHAGGRVVLVSHGDPIAIMRVGLEGRPLTVYDLHHTVYPSRASVTQVDLHPHAGIRLSYFDVTGEGPN